MNLCGVKKYYLFICSKQITCWIYVRLQIFYFYNCSQIYISSFNNLVNIKISNVEQLLGYINI